MASERSTNNLVRNEYYDDASYPADAYPANPNEPRQPRYSQRAPKGKRRDQFDTESESDNYSDFTMQSDAAREQEDFQRYRAQAFAQSGISSPTSFGEFGARPREPYPAWTAENAIPLSKEEVEDIFIDLANKFGFQRDSMRNMYDHLMIMLDSRASRMPPQQALLTLHADYIGGDHANYRKWYFAAQLDLDDAIGVTNFGGKGAKLRGKKAKVSPEEADHAGSDLESAAYRWRTKMNQMSSYDRVRQLALYLLCWGEGAQVRFVPEALCFIFKCADDYYHSSECQTKVEPLAEGSYLRNVICPLYNFIRDQGFEVVGGKYIRREKDHAQIIGYDDVNQLFWYPEGIERIVLFDKSRLVNIPPAQRFLYFGQVDWNRVFFKTYFEKRTWMHAITNFARIWIIHVCVYWYYTSYNSPRIYSFGAQVPDAAATWSVVGLGGAVATTIMLIATIAEFFFVPTTWNNTSHLSQRMVFLLVILAINVGPSIYILGISRKSSAALVIGIVQFFISLVTTLVFAIIPSGRLFGDRVASKSRKYLASQTFTASYPKLNYKDRLMSIGLWALVFACKLTESYFFLSLSFRDPVRVMVGMTIQGCNDKLLGHQLCSNQATFTLAIMFIMDLILFFLDTYLWYVIWVTIFSVARSFYIGISVWTPWRNIFARLPKRIYVKLLATSDMEVKYKPKVLVSQVWNAIIISMYREHLLSIDHVQKLLYHQVPSDQEGKRTLRAPTFFIAQDDRKGLKSEFYPHQGEAERRISFFAQSLSTPIPEPLPVDALPTFTVLTPHYGEKILLSLREIIREEDQNTRVTLLEYLKQLHPVEWDNFVKDTKILAEESSLFANGPNPFGESEKEQSVKSKIDDLPFYCVGFKSAAPEYTLRTRIWASLRAQTLYRTVSGFMNYSKAIKLLYRVENPEVVQLFGGNTDKLERELERMARRKFKFIISMQRYSKFTKEEQENAEFLLRAYPDLQIAYLDEEPTGKEGEEPRLYSALIDGHSEILPDGRRRPKFRIQLPGNPILGDGKSDNQNHALVFYRGEFLQLIDANQDNYLEECLKIRNILGEFEEYHSPSVSPYSPNHEPSLKAPVAIVGAREYIFSENIGVLGDVAAGKEQTFGTLSARTLAQVGGKLHYGHPDFLNAVFMTTRGGVSKAQKGLHLNEDIFAGVTAFCRGGRIKHTEYYQCGKGRDLGFGSILNFTTKIGTGMGEQLLSREYYYLGTQLPLDRFLTFYYGHPGFQINNIFIILAVQLFMLSMVFLGSLASSVTVCNYNPDAPPNAPLTPPGCYNLVPVYDWIKRCIISIFIVFFIAFLPLFLQELTERGLFRAITRLLKHFLSLSPLFEVFTTQIYTNSIVTNLTFGGARYIATGRGFATARIPFSILYSRFAGPSMYLGIRTLLMLLYVTLTIWVPHLIYFWVTVIALVISPFIFNPHQFSFTDFMVDYREYLRWMSRGNSRSHANSWIGYCRLSRTRITGYKRKRLGHPSEKLSGDIPRPSITNLFLSEIFSPLLLAVLFTIAYLFVKSFSQPQVDALLRIAVIAFGPVIINAGVLAAMFFISIVFGPMLSSCCTKFGSVMAGIAHAVGVVTLVVFFELLWFLEAWDFSHAVLGMIAVAAIQRWFFKLLIVLFLTREFKHDETNKAWWTGKWYGRGLGAHMISQPLREYVCKIVEMSLFGADFILCHFVLLLQLPILLIPFIDRAHSTMLFWLSPNSQIRPPIYSLKQKAQRRSIVIRYGIILAIVSALFVALLVIPAVIGRSLTTKPPSFI